MELTQGVKMNKAVLNKIVWILPLLLVASQAQAIQLINNSGHAIQMKVNGYDAELKAGSIADLPSKVKPPYNMTLVRQNKNGETVVCQRKAYSNDILVLPEQCKWVKQDMATTTDVLPANGQPGIPSASAEVPTAKH